MANRSLIESVLSCGVLQAKNMQNLCSNMTNDIQHGVNLGDDCQPGPEVLQADCGDIPGLTF